MQIRLSVTTQHRASGPVDVLVTAPEGTPFEALAGGLRAASGSLGSRFYVGDTLLEDETELGLPPLVEGALITIDVPGAPITPTSSLRLHVVGGPDAGGVHLLGRGQATLGRGADADVQVNDPDVSRMHATLDIAPDWVTVADLGSTNGTQIERAPVHAEPTLLLPEALLRIGESSLTIVSQARPGTANAPIPDGAGHLEVRRPLRQQISPSPVHVALPPVVGGRRRGRAANRKREAVEQNEALDAAKARIDVALTAEARLRRQRDLDAAALLVTALERDSRLWERRRGHPDALSIRVGAADLPSQVTASAGDGGAVERLLATDVPVTLSLRETGPLGVVGPRGRAAALVRSLLAQLAGAHSPSDLEIVVISPHKGSADWAFTRWLPHLLPTEAQDCRLLLGLDAEQAAARAAELLGRIEFRRSEPGNRDPAGRWTGRLTVVLLDIGPQQEHSPTGSGRAGGRQLPGLSSTEVSRLLLTGPAVGVHALCLAERESALPPECDSQITVTGEVSTRLDVHVAGKPDVANIVADLVSPAWAERFGRALAPLRETTPGARGPRLPEQVRLLDLLRLDLVTPAKVTAGWADGGSPAEAVLGTGPDGAFALDLDEHGPHLLVGGAAGAGKSEALRTLIASLAVAAPPEELGLILIDGSARPDNENGPASSFADCVTLPHVLAAFCDLDAATAEQAVSLLDQELERRAQQAEQAATGARRRPRPDAPGRLVVVVDEFVDLAERFPLLAGGVVAAARNARSLGVNVLASTSRPLEAVGQDGSGLFGQGGVCVALRVADARESLRLIGVHDAALLGDGPAGRGYVHTPDGNVTPVQIAQSSGRMARTATLRPTVVKQDWRELGDPPVRRGQTSEGNGPTDLALLAGAIAKAGESRDPGSAPPAIATR